MGVMKGDVWSLDYGSYELVPNQPYERTPNSGHRDPSCSLV